jgi:hypothetical protein
MSTTESAAGRKPFHGYATVAVVAFAFAVLVTAGGWFLAAKASPTNHGVFSDVHDRPDVMIWVFMNRRLLQRPQFRCSLRCAPNPHRSRKFCHPPWLTFHCTVFPCFPKTGAQTIWADLLRLHTARPCAAEGAEWSGCRKCNLNEH